MNQKAECFNAQITDNCRFLVLGSMPGQISLKQQAYYAHPRNAFWPIMAAIFGFSSTLDYSARVEQLNQHGVGLWDVIASCYRQGSLDSAIKADALEVNDFVSCFELYPNLNTVLLNGQKAATLFKRQVMPKLTQANIKLETYLMPSTSPAYASIQFDEKLEIWRDILQPKSSLKNA
ncbi:DNA-deoxyinosine glycosylase [Catenovulum sp. 2E275]|uniref:DNA-deoxyinosine glycosylase n=1 Tax=Catenovulum sp. 2E275 TaxID=2980497 RepID=UPI0021D2135A|nr:DNA-deoxyinosine glycosylase [Catenovulum sp. 2E275]MCU4676882.1 DNA-deoxyinosine glycosylase [Catenovulum sp. 2E275]